MENTPTPTNQSIQSGSISIYPAFFSIETNRDQSESLTINISNTSGTKVTISFSSAKFSQNPKSLANVLEKIPFYEEFFQAPQDITIAPGSTEAIEFLLLADKIENFPIYPALIIKAETASSIEESATAETALNPTQTAFEYALPIYITTDKTKDKLTIERFSTSRKINFTNEIDIRAIIENSGDGFIRPQGYIELHKQDIFKSEEKTRIESLPINKNSQMLLPQSQLTTETTWIREIPGKYQATLYAYTPELLPINQTITFWIIPQAFIIKAVLSLLFLIAIIILTLKAIKSRLPLRIKNIIASKFKRKERKKSKTKGIKPQGNP